MAAVPLPIVIAAIAGTSASRLRVAALGLAGTGAVASLLPILMGPLWRDPIHWPSSWPAPFSGIALGASEVGLPLVALPFLLWIITLAATPRSRLARAGIARTALSTSLITVAFLSESVPILILCWLGTSHVFLRGLLEGGDRRANRNCSLYLRLSGVLFVSGAVLIAMDSAPLAQQIGVWTLLLAIFIRKGVFPFHAWIPNAFDRGRIGPTVLFCAPQLGTYVAAVLIIPIASPGVLQTTAILSLSTAVYGAAQALFQNDARRSIGYLFVSQSSLVLAGLGCATVDALAGSFVLWVSSALAFTGIARAILALEARRGRLGLNTHHGGYEQMPLLATAFLVLGLACTAFPGTLGFVGGEMLVHGAVSDLPWLGLLVVAASAFTGLAVMRMYFSLFCGKHAEGIELHLRPREAVVFAFVAGFLLTAGLLPRHIVDVSFRAATTALAK